MLEPYPLHVLSLSKNTKKRRSDYSFRDRYVYFYYDFVMKIPGIGGGGECGWLEDVPENGLCPYPSVTGPPEAASPCGS